MNLSKNEVHIWTISLKDAVAKNLQRLRQILSDSENKRANRFHFNEHKAKFIVTHNALRHILSRYLLVSPEAINFDEDDYGKPFIKSNEFAFNLTHSKDYALVACAQNGTLGIDVEYIQTSFEDGVAKRFFSEEENHQLQQSTAQMRLPLFYQIWSRKEAIIKAVGKGLHLPLKSFTVNSRSCYEQIQLENKFYYLCPLNLDPEYAGAFASDQPIHKIWFCYYFEQDGLA